jgi:Ca2+-binding RTX toxin-like protein
MTVTVISTNTIVTGIGFNPTGPGDDLYVLSNITLMSTNSQVASISLSSVSLQIDGSLIGAFRALTFESGATFGQLLVGTSGTVSGLGGSSQEVAVAMFGSKSGITNHGVITAPGAICIYMSGLEGDILNTGLITGATGVQFASASNNSRLVNYGTITGSNQFDGSIDAFEGRGVFVQSANAYIFNGATGSIGSTATGGSGIHVTGLNGGGLVFDNFGDVWAASGIGIDLSTVTLGQSLIRVLNSGTVTGLVGSYTGSANADLLTNRGEMIGAVLMGDGVDTFDNRGGSVEGNVDLGAGVDFYSGANGTVYGMVFGGTGHDRFIGNANLAEEFDGGADIDTLDFRTLGTVVVSLDDTLLNAGSAAGDTYVRFENVNGSNAGGDHIVGNTAANVINGMAGNDTLSGGDGADYLRGWSGLDVMTGGKGNDTFRFLAFTDFGDQITDFASNAVGNNDRFQFMASVLGGGLAAGTLAAVQFQSRADNLAQDDSDRFIFRTSDRTLWFDVDGNLSVAAIMVADLQANATMTASDILLS